jgi:hypothetical protein
MPTPKLALPYITQSQFSKEISWNEAQNRLDALVQLVAVDYLDTPPGSPAANACYLVGASPTGVWTGQAQAVALYLSSAGIFITAQEGMLAFDQTLDGFRYYDGSAWTPGFGVGSGVTLFTDLTDAPGDYSGDGLKYVRVNAGATALEFQTFPSLITTLLGLTDTPDTYVGQALKGVRVNAGETAVEFVTLAASISTVLGLSDTPDAYTGQGDKLVAVKADESGVEFITAPEVVTLPTTYPYDLGGSFGGTPAADSVLLRYPFPRDAAWAEDFPDSQAVCATGPSAETDFSLEKNGIAFGILRFAESATIGTFPVAPATSFLPGDILTMTAPATLNGLESLGWAFALTRGA